MGERAADVAGADQRDLLAGHLSSFSDNKEPRARRTRRDLGSFFRRGNR
jgi:hypothetical protein